MSSEPNLEPSQMDEIRTALDGRTTDELVEYLDERPCRQELIDRIIKKYGPEGLYEDFCTGESDREACERTGRG